MNTINTDIVIIGSGPAGLSAAIAAKKQGAKRVHILERLPYPGGMLPQCIHKGFGARRYGEELTGSEYAERLIKEAEAAGTSIYTDTFVTEVTPNPDDKNVTVRTLSPRTTGEAAGMSEFCAGAVILATGCRERTIGQLNAAALSKHGRNGSPLITGARPSGVFTAGTAQRMINLGGYHMGRRAVVLGSGDIGLIVSRRLTLTGTEVVCIVEQSDAVGGMAKNKRNAIDAYRIPLLTRHTVTELHGETRLTGVTIAKLETSGAAVPGSEQKIDCDTLLLSVGLIPETDLLQQLLQRQHRATNRNDSIATHFGAGSRSRSRIIVCGNASQIRTMADDIADDGISAGIRATQLLC